MDSMVEDLPSVTPLALSTARGPEESVQALIYQPYKMFHCDNCDAVFTGSDNLYKPNNTCKGKVCPEAPETSISMSPSRPPLVQVQSCSGNSSNFVTNSLRQGFNCPQGIGFKDFGFEISRKAERNPKFKVGVPGSQLYPSFWRLCDSGKPHNTTRNNCIWIRSSLVTVFSRCVWLVQVERMHEVVMSKWRRKRRSDANSPQKVGQPCRHAVLTPARSVSLSCRGCLPPPSRNLLPETNTEVKQLLILLTRFARASKMASLANNVTESRSPISELLQPTRQPVAKTIDRDSLISRKYFDDQLRQCGSRGWRLLNERAGCSYLLTRADGLGTSHPATVYLPSVISLGTSHPATVYLPSTTHSTPKNKEDELSRFWRLKNEVKRADEGEMRCEWNSIEYKDGETRDP
ncbi:hypothetical protein PR048_018716, partial [Dryococelus australis]